MPEHHIDKERGYEVQDARVRPVVIFTITILAVIGFALVTASWFYSVLDSRFAARDRPASPLAQPGERPPEPRLQVLPRLELDAVRERDRQRLEQYRWIDRTQGVVQIPIERAMELVAERGIPTSSPPPATEEAQ